MDARLCHCWAAKSLPRRGVRPSFWKSCPQENSSQGKAKGKSGAGGAPKGGFSDQLGCKALTTETHKYVEYGNVYIELYDLESDPYELESMKRAPTPPLSRTARRISRPSRPAPRKGAGRPRTLRSTLFSSS